MADRSETDGQWREPYRPEEHGLDPSTFHSDGVALIAAERLRQVTAEGWTPEHDDEHTDGELRFAASLYAARATNGAHELHNPVPEGWPWHPLWWKPTDSPVRNLVKAGALIAAEIDRLQRARSVTALSSPSPEGGPTAGPTEGDAHARTSDDG